LQLLRKFSHTILPILLLFLAGCASVTGAWETQFASTDFVDGTRVLAEVILVATRDQVIAPTKGLLYGWRDKLIAAGYTDNDIVDGSEVTMWSYCYGHNSGVSICAHNGYYVAHVPLKLREGLQGFYSWETNGDLVEVELTKTATGHLVGNVVSVYRKSGDWGTCRRTNLQQTSETYSTLMTIAGVGPARAIWIECGNMESEGWVRRPVLRAPQSAGPPISEWIKLSQ
jgi:hypothetical protein